VRDGRWIWNLPSQSAANDFEGPRAVALPAHCTSGVHAVADSDPIKCQWRTAIRLGTIVTIEGLDVDASACNKSDSEGRQTGALGGGLVHAPSGSPSLRRVTKTTDGHWKDPQRSRN
jgi:hypothetical protein